MSPFFELDLLAILDESPRTSPGAGGLAIHHLSAGNERCPAIDHNIKVGELLVQLGLSALTSEMASMR